ncbi:MAG TPA: SIMPL domain-containing protein, partial [Sphingomicrobium sp.]|nr:SIMPL domain-containing protein [Sphingomicrobium sp.]
MNKLLLAVMLAASPAALNAQAPQPEITIGPASTVLSLTAEGETRRAPDIAMFSAGVVTQAPTASGAIRDNAARMAAVVAALKRAGIAARDIQTSTISLNPVFSNPDRDRPQALPRDDRAPRIVGYQARNTVQVRVRNLADMGQVIDTLVEVGA